MLSGIERSRTGITNRADKRPVTLADPPAFSNAQKAKRDFGVRLGEIRKTAGLTGLALASSCGWSESKVSRIENGKTAPSAEDLRLWAAQCEASDQTADLIASLELPDDVEGAVKVRNERLKLLHQKDRTFAVLIEEAVLRNVMGDTDVMAGQLGYLLTISELPSVSLGILHLGADRTSMPPVEDFWIFDEAQVNVELISGWLNG
ncbi:MAG TPA: Scr1 family TA system antitoxin-like transcriptional regulator [Kribbella sp.]|uniref:Scr1 family TA system antitoxin-like transcriptional regulator n=1 Tax=Kribbella sp. TaxID=1871183 RepID=UPI002D78316A|nr:Scr1 family TA system antitoxin-like transcriptional regulator [Kribbella sp.]HET6291840.1 Scr1 family TA system antitoxin-like transcriptional regulator [Kribbella sp.]